MGGGVWGGWPTSSPAAGGQPDGTGEASIYLGIGVGVAFSLLDGTAAPPSPPVVPPDSNQPNDPARASTRRLDEADFF